jgi:hypothetical protein
MSALICGTFKVPPPRFEPVHPTPEAGAVSITTRLLTFTLYSIPLFPSSLSLVLFRPGQYPVNDCCIQLVLGVYCLWCGDIGWISPT